MLPPSHTAPKAHLSLSISIKSGAAPEFAYADAEGAATARGGDVTGTEPGLANKN